MQIKFVHVYFFLFLASVWIGRVCAQQEYTAGLPPEVMQALQAIPIQPAQPAVPPVVPEQPAPGSAPAPMVTPMQPAPVEPAPYVAPTAPAQYVQPSAPAPAPTTFGQPAAPAGQYTAPTYEAPGQVQQQSYDPTYGAPGQTQQPTYQQPYAGAEQVQQPSYDPTYEVPGQTQQPAYDPGVAPAYGVSGQVQQPSYDSTGQTQQPAPTYGVPGQVQQPAYDPGVAPAYGVPGQVQQQQYQAPYTAPAPAPYTPPVPVGPPPVGAAPSAPTKIFEPDRPTAQVAVPSELKGIDTLDIDEPGGNWVVKRVWWEKAEEKVNKIEDVVDSIMDARGEFFEKRNKADNELFDPFYLEVGLEQGQLGEIMDYLMRELQEKKEKQVRLSKEKRDFIKVLEEQKKRLKQLKSDIEAVIKIENVGIDEAITQLVEQMNKARAYKKEARELFTEIGKVLDHNRARDLFYKIEEKWQNVKSIKAYIASELTEHVEELISTAKQQMERIKEALDELEKKGVSFKEQQEKLEQKAEAKQELKERQVELEMQQEQQVGWFTTISSSIMSWIAGTWDWISSFWTTGEEAEVQPMPQAVEEPVDPTTPKAGEAA